MSSSTSIAAAAHQHSQVLSITIGDNDAPRLALTRPQLAALGRTEAATSRVRFQARELVTRKLFQPAAEVLAGLIALLDPLDLHVVAAIIKHVHNEFPSPGSTIDPLLEYDAPDLLERALTIATHGLVDRPGNEIHECIDGILEYLDLLDEHLIAFSYSIGEVVVIVSRSEALGALASPRRGEAFILLSGRPSSDSFTAPSNGNA